MNGTKPWWSASGIVGPLVSVLAMILTAVFGLEISPETQAIIVNNLVAGIGAIVTLFGAIVGIWGRARADKTVTLTRKMPE